MGWSLIEAVIIVLSAIIGVFTWIHGRDIFNNYTPGEWLGALGDDMTAHCTAWVAILISFILLILGLWCRRKYQDAYIKRDDIKQIANVINSLESKQPEKGEEPK